MPHLHDQEKHRVRFFRLPASAVDAPASDATVIQFLPYRDPESHGRRLFEQLMAEADALFRDLDWSVPQ